MKCFVVDYIYITVLIIPVLIGPSLTISAQPLSQTPNSWSYVACSCYSKAFWEIKDLD